MTENSVDQFGQLIKGQITELLYLDSAMCRLVEIQYGEDRKYICKYYRQKDVYTVASNYIVIVMGFSINCELTSLLY